MKYRLARSARLHDLHAFMPFMSSMAAVVAGLAVVGACGGRPTAPAAPSPSSESPGVLRIDGPSSIAPRASAHYRAIASFADGRTVDVTAGASWTSAHIAPSNEAAAALLVAAGGMVTGGSPGEADLIANYSTGMGSQSATLRVLVLEPGTFRVSGRVTDSSGALHARVAVVAGTGAGQTTLARDSDGSYAFYGLAGAVTLEVSEESFQTETRTLIVNDHQTVDFSLKPLPLYDSVSGEWLMTLRASLSCGSALPDDAATRMFQANVSQRGGTLSLYLSSATRVILEGYPVAGFGGVSGESVTFYLQSDNPDEQWPPRYVLLEMLEPRRFLGMTGFLRGLRTGNTMLGTMSGEFSLYRATGTNYLAPGTVLERGCRRLTTSPIPTSETHTFRLDRNE